MRKTICFSANRTCHHDDYYLLISQFGDVINVKNLSQKLKYLFTSNTIYFLDIDMNDLIFTPLIILRSIWGGKGVGLSVRTEYLIQDIAFLDFIKDRTSKYPHMIIKRILFLAIKRFSKTSIISIHKGHAKSKNMKLYINDFMYDPQLWDLSILKPSEEIPVELIDFNEKSKPIILVAGRLNEQRSKLELFNYLSINHQFHFIIAGNIEEIDKCNLINFKNCTIIDRFVSNEELFALYKLCDIVYCFYTNERPSGFFGRAVQLEKEIIVRKDGYLHKMYGEYVNLLPVKSLIELNSTKRNKTETNNTNKFNDLELFKSYTYLNT